VSDRYPRFYCDCGRALEPSLARAAAVRCLDCRDGLGSGNHLHPRLRLDPVEAPSPVVAAANTVPTFEYEEKEAA
jgi:hypothetical protein